MQFWILICVIWLGQLFVFCAANKHGVDHNYEYGTRTTYERTLIDDVNKVPKNYTIIYKYFRAKHKSIASLEIDVNVESEGRVTDNDKIIEAKIHINNALNVTATIRIDYVGLIEIPMWQYSWFREDFYTKSITFIHKKDADPSKTRQFAQNAIGQRREGDSLLHFESLNITNISRFPSGAFEYSGPNYITYVGFSFNSPTAMVMINTSFVGEREFNAVAYDMNTEHFVANMSVYGIKSVFRPHQFEGVI